MEEGRSEPECFRLSQSPQKLRTLQNATESESKSAETINSATEHNDELLPHGFTFSTKRSLQVEEVQSVVPSMKELQNLLASQKIINVDGVRVRKVKIVVTKKQLKLLLENARKLQCRRRSSNYTDARRGCHKWRPSLSAISEVQDF